MLSWNRIQSIMYGVIKKNTQKSTFRYKFLL